MDAPLLVRISRRTAAGKAAELVSVHGVRAAEAALTRRCCPLSASSDIVALSVLCGNEPSVDSVFDSGIKTQRPGSSEALEEPACVPIRTGYGSGLGLDPIDFA